MPCLVEHRDSHIFITLWALSQNCEKRLLVLSCLSVRLCPPAWNNLAPTGQILMKLRVCGFFKNLWRNFRCHLNLTRIKNALQEGRYMYICDNISLNSSD